MNTRHQISLWTKTGQRVRELGTGDSGTLRTSPSSESGFSFLLGVVKGFTSEGEGVEVYLNLLEDPNKPNLNSQTFYLLLNPRHIKAQTSPRGVTPILYKNFRLRLTDPPWKSRKTPISFSKHSILIGASLYYSPRQRGCPVLTLRLVP